jgi:hypothetical protein
MLRIPFLGPAIVGGGASYSAETLAYQTRVEADGGSLYDIDIVEAAIINAKANGYYANAIGWYSSLFGVKASGRLTPIAKTADAYYGADGASNAFDDSTATAWNSGNTALPHWLKVQYFTAKVINKIRIYSFKDAGGAATKNFTVSGSNDDSDYTDIYSGLCVDQANGWQSDFTFTNTTAYTYYKVTFTDNYRADNYIVVMELELYQTDKSAGVITKLYDLSSQNNDLTTASPIVVAENQQNSLPTIYQAGTTYALTSGSAPALTANFEVFSVLKYLGGGSDSNEVIHVGAASGGAMLGFTSSKPRIGRSAIAWDYAYGSALYNSYRLYGFRYDGSNHYLRHNGSDLGSSANAPTVNSGTIKFGPSSGTASGLNYLAELLILDNAAEDRTAVEAAINARWALY